MEEDTIESLAESKLGIRLQKFLSDCGVASRRKAAELIRDGEVSVNGHVEFEPGKHILPGRDKVRLGKKPVLPVERGLVLFHKPKGVMSTLSDPGGRPCLAHYLTRPLQSYYSAGRLDFDSSGLLVMTNDGELANRLAHPRYAVERTYEVKISGKLEEKSLERLARGILLDDGPVKAKAKILRTSNASTWVSIGIFEGRNRIVRRIFEKLRHPVLKLIRVAHGPCKLGSLKPGEIRRYTQAEYERLRETIFGAEKKTPTKDFRKKAAQKARARRKSWKLAEKKQTGRKHWDDETPTDTSRYTKEGQRKKKFHEQKKKRRDSPDRRRSESA